MAKKPHTLKEVLTIISKRMMVPESEILALDKKPSVCIARRAFVVAAYTIGYRFEDIRKFLGRSATTINKAYYTGITEPYGKDLLSRKRILSEERVRFEKEAKQKEQKLLVS